MEPYTCHNTAQEGQLWFTWSHSQAFTPLPMGLKSWVWEGSL